MIEKEKVIIIKDTEDIQKHGYVPTKIPIVNIKPPEKPVNSENNKSDKHGQ
jgi:hypothetical protein